MASDLDLAEAPSQPGLERGLVVGKIIEDALLVVERE
jgi:hypothetical protein